MAGNWADETGGKSPFSAAPAGLQQNRVRDETNGAQPWLRPAWQTGGQIGSTQNAFNDDFYQRMYDQYEEERRKVEKDSSYVSNLFARKDFTGIVGWNQQINKDNPFIKVDEDRTFNVGDIYDNGQFLGNVYDLDSGLSLEEANSMVAPHIFGDKAADVYKDADGDQQRIKDQILKQGEKQGQQVEAYLTRLPYQQSVDRLMSDWDDSIADEVLTTAGGIIGGAVAGIPLGPWGILGGAILGGAGSLMNKDETNRAVANAVVSTGLIGEEVNPAVAATHGISQWANIATSKLSVFGNLLSGATDALTGNWDDEESEAQRVRSEGNVGAIVGQGVAGFADGLLTSASGVGMLTYMGLSEGSAVSAAASKALGDGEWDEVTGSFHRYETIEQRLAAAGSSAIDVAQGMLPGVLRNTAAKGIGGSRSVFGAADDIAIPTNRVTVMDTTYKINSAGVAVGAEKNLLAWVAPSSIVNKLSVRASALTENARRGGVNPVSADDMYRAAVRLENASVPWKMAMINGFGEASEEVLQTYLNATAVGWQAEPMEYVQAAVAGFSMGAGMSVGARVGTVSSERRQLFQANTLLRADGQDALTLQEWRTKDKAEQTRLATPVKSAERVIRAQNKQLLADWTESAITSQVGLNEYEDALRAISKAKTRVGEDGLEDMADILPFQSVRIPSYHILHSAKTTVEKLQARNEALKQMVQENPQAEPIQQTLQALLDNVIVPKYLEFQNSGNTRALQEINDTLKQYWTGDTNQRRAVELVFSRSPNDNVGSFVMLLPQIDAQLTADNIDGMSKLSQSLEKVLSHDNDGDKLKHQARYIPDDDSRRVLRLGANLWASVGGRETATTEASLAGGGFLNIADRSYEAKTLELMRLDATGTDLTAQDAVRNAFDDVLSVLTEGLGTAVNPATLRNFRRDLDLNPSGAKASFYKALAADASKLLQLGEAGTGNRQVSPEARIAPETNIGLWIEDQIQIGLSSWQDGAAQRVRTDVLTATQGGAQPSPMAADAQTVQGQPAATKGQTLEMITGGSDAFRSRAKLAYGLINSSAMDSNGVVNPDALREGLIQWYSVLTRMRPLSQTDTVLQGGNPVIQDARKDLENIARTYYPDEFRAAPEATLVQIATTPFYSVTEQQSQNFDQPLMVGRDTTVAQVLLRNAAERQGNLVPTALGEMDVAIAYNKLNAGQATVTLIGEPSLDRLLDSSEWAQLGKFDTLRGLTTGYAARGGATQRKAWREHAQAHPSYKMVGERGANAFSEDSAPSMYRIVVDVVRQAVDSELAHDPKGTGHATGRLAVQDRTFHEKTVLPTFDAVRTIVKELGVESKQAIMDALESNTQAVQYLLRMFTPEMRIRIIGRADAQGDIVLPEWFFDILTETDSERAAMLFFNANLDLEIAAWDDRSSEDDSQRTPSNTWVDLYQGLSEFDRREFNDMRANSTNVQALVDRVNQTFATDRAPMLAWRTDTSLYNPAPTRGGWQWGSPSAERRQAITDAHTYLVPRAASIRGDLDLSMSNYGFAQSMLDDLSSRDGEARSRAQARISALENRLVQAQTLSTAAMGPAGIREFVQMAQEGLDIASAQKGKPGPRSAQFGDTDVRRDQTTFDSQLGQIVGSIAAVDAKSLQFNPQMLTRALRIQTNSGVTIEWNPLDTKAFLELFVADGGAYQGLLFDLISPSIYEENATGHASYQHLLPKNLESIVDSSIHQQLLLGEGGRDRRENDELFIAYVNALTPDNNVVRLMSKLAVARTTSSVEATQRLGDRAYDQLVTDVASALRDLSGLSADGAQSAQLRMREAAITSYLTRMGLDEINTAFKNDFLNGDVTALTVLVDIYKAETERAQLVFDNAKNEENTIALVTAMQRELQATQLIHMQSTNDILQSVLKIEWGTPNEVITRSAIQEYIDTFGTVMLTTATGDDRMVLEKYSLARDRARANDGLVNLPDQSDWEHLAKLVSLHNTLWNQDTRAASFVPTAQVDDFQYFDPTFQYLGEYLVSPEIHGAAQKFRELVFDVKPAQLTPDMFRRNLESSVLNPNYLGTWTPDLVVQHLGADRALDASGSEVQINIGGMTPKNYRASDIAARRTNEHPPVEMARSIAFDATTFHSEVSNVFAPGLNGEPWAILEGASVVAPRYDRASKQWTGTGPTLVVKDANGVEVERISLHTALRDIYNGGTPAEGSPTTIKGLDLKSLQNASVSAFSRAKAVHGENVTASIEMQMFHPADKPAEPQWANNLHFDGTLSATDSASSLYSALQLDTAGLVQQLQRAALDAIKGYRAIFTHPHPKDIDEKNALDLNSTIHEMVKKVLMTQMGDKYYLPISTYRSIYRMMRDHLVVVGTDTDGQQQILSSEQALTAVPDGLSNLRVVELSRETLETLRGSTSGSGHPRLLDRAPLPGGEADGPWTGAFDPAQLARVPELGRRIDLSQSTTDESRTQGARDIGSALRSSGLLSTERSTTYRYKSWTASDRVLKHRTFESFDQARAGVRDARASVAFREDLITQSERTLQALANEVRMTSRVNDATKEMLLQDIGGVPKNDSIRRTSEVHTVADLSSLLTNTSGRIWRYQNDGTGLRNDGILTSMTQVSGAVKDHIAPVDDVVWVELKTFPGRPGTPEWNSSVIAVLAEARQLGLTVALTHPTEPGAVTEAESLLLSPGSGYGRLRAGMDWLYGPTNPDMMQQTLIAREATLLQTQRQELENTAIIAVDNSGYVVADAEGVLADPRADQNGFGLSVTSNIVPTTGYAGFGAPNSAPAGARVSSALKELSSESGIQYLAEQAIAGGSTRSVEELMIEIGPLIQKAAANVDERTGLPKRNTSFDPGDIIALVHGRTGQIMLSRWGYDPTDVDLDAQGEVPFDGVIKEGVAASGAVLYVGDKQIRQDYASLNRGRIQRWITNDPVYGLRVIQTLPISAIGAKFIGSMTGKKSRAVKADDRLPSVPLLGRIWPNFYDNMAGRVKKGATEGMITSAREAVFFFGWDAGRTLANALKVRPEGWNVQEWAALTQADRDGIIAQVRAELEVYKQNVKDRLTSGREVADAVMRSDKSLPAAQLMVAQRQDRLGIAAAQQSQLPASRDAADVEMQYLAAVTEYLRGDGTLVSQVLGAPGFNQPANVENKASFRMPAALTDFIDTNPGLRQYIVEDINARMDNIYAADGSLEQGWIVGNDWKVTSRDAQGRAALFTIQTERIDATGEDQTERVETNRLTATTDTVSDQQQTVASALGLDLGYRIRKKSLDVSLQKRGYADLAAITSLSSSSQPVGPIRPLTRAEQNRRSRAAQVARGYLTPIDRTQWDTEDPDSLAATENYRKIYNVLGLNADGRFQDLVDSLVRVFYRAQHDESKPGVDQLDPDEVKFATDHIIKQLSAGKAPVMEGRMPVIHAEIMDLIATNGTWVPDGLQITDNRRVALLQWALDTTYASTTQITPDGQLELDGLILSYEKVLQEGFWTASAFPDVIHKLLDPSSGLFKSSVDPLTQMKLQRDDPYANLDNSMDATGMTNQSESPASKLSLATQTEIARRRRRDMERGAQIGGLDSRSVSEIAQSGRRMRDEVNYTNAFFREWHAIRTIVPQLNPFLWLWNPVDMAARMTAEQATALLNGTSTGILGRGIRRGIQALANVGKDTNPETRTQSFIDALGIQQPFITEEANRLIPVVVQRLIGDAEWRSHIAQETRHRPNDALNSRREAALQKGVDTVSRIQDVMHGVPPASQAHLYIQGILEHERLENPNVTAVDVLLQLNDQPLFYLQDGPRTAHNVASNKIKNIKAAGQTTAGVLVNSWLMPMASSSNSVVNASANTLLILTKFRNFAFGSARFLTGSYGFDAAAAVLMQGRIGGARARGLQGRVGNPGMSSDYISEVLESADLADAFIKSGLSWTGLFFAGLALSASGITGEDEEERRRRRIEQLQGLGRLYDPRDIANDFRNRDALWLEGLSEVPFLGWLSALAQVPTEPGQPERWPVQPHWTVNFFTAPIVGMAEFFQTGEFSDLVRGFESAVGQMPLVNTNFFWDAVNTSQQMYEAATNNVPEDPGELASVNSLFLKVFGTLEKATFELAFINELVSTVDTYNRNPWGMPEIMDDGTIDRDRDGEVQGTESTDLTTTTDPRTGEEIVIDKKQTRSYDEGLWRAFASNNQTFALFATMFTGFQFNKAGSFMRGDQTISTRTIEKDGLSTEDAETLILSVWDPNNNREVLTRDGMESLMRSLHAGTVKATDPALQNIFITYEQRAEIQESLQTKIIVEGVEVYGLSTDKATQRMWDIWYGPDNNPYVTPLADVVWGQGEFKGDQGIPYNQTTTYRQLNTTWVTGPDGRPWATGLSRGSMADFFSPFKGYQGSVGGGIRGNLDVDGLLNSTDPMANINTGLRSLTRVDDSLEQPNDQSIIDKMDEITDKVIDAIKDLNADMMGNNGFGRGGYGFGRRGGGGGGGGGYASNPYMPFLNGMRSPYLDNVPQIYINNINPRRASIRRERFESNRGRLNNQQ
ncbi:hypothetical protein SEA_FEDE_31 [Microbacterium phage Fede]|nr:hypothetical protein SEA_FEDE_31 [Microbacterium phage Fede]